MHLACVRAQPQRLLPYVTLRDMLLDRQIDTQSESSERAASLIASRDIIDADFARAAHHVCRARTRLA